MTTAGPLAAAAAPEVVAVRGTRQAVGRAYQLRGFAVASAVLAFVAAAMAGIVVGPADLAATDIIQELLDHLPFVSIDSGLSDQQRLILEQWRLPRVALGALVGASLALSGASYQGVFRNPLASPWLLGSAAGAGLGATIVIVFQLDVGWGPFNSVPAGAFVGALVGVSMSMALGKLSGQSTTGLLLAGVATAAFLTALQTFLQQRNTDTLRLVYAWVFGRIATSGWSEVALLAPYVVLCGAVLLVHRRHLDVLRVGDDEASSLGLHPARVRAIVVVVASLLTAAAVSVSGLISFVGIIVPHMVRLLFGSSYRIVLPLSMICGATFMVLVDIAARTLMSPAEVPIGVVTAFFGAPFFGLVLWSTTREVSS